MNKGERILDGIPHDVTAQLLAYLGRNLSTEEREAFESRLLEEEFFSRQIEQAEFLLLEEYAEGSLPEEVRTRLADWIDSSADARRQVEITRSLRRIATSPAKRRAPRVQWWAMVAAACIAAVALLPLLHRRHSSAPTPLVARNTPNAVPSSPTAEDTILLVAERLRGAAPAPARVAYSVHPERTVRLQIVVPSAQIGSVYTVVVRPEGVNTPVARFETVPVQGSPQAKFIQVKLPAHMLEAGDYAVELSAPGERFDVPFRTTVPK
jgi:hypothetical protein